MTRHGCAFDLTSQLIENLNAQSMTTIKIEKLLNKDWDYLRINKEDRKTLLKRLAPYIKAGKATSKRRTSCFNPIEQTWSIADQNKFSRLYYFKSSETFFHFMTMMVMHTLTPSRRQKAIKKLNNIIIARLMMYKRPNIPSNTWRFNTFANWIML